MPKRKDEGAPACGGCGVVGQADLPGPLCPECWLAVPFEVKADYVQAETLHQRAPSPELFDEARLALVLAARMEYRMTVLQRLWRKTWRKKFEAKYRLEHELDRQAAQHREEGFTD